MRAALLPSGPDPFLLAYWLNHYRTWADAVDSLDVVVCGQNDPELREYVEQQIAAVPHASVIFLKKITDHGRALDILVADTAADIVVLCENDAFVRTPAVMSECFARLESGEVDLIGTPRSYASDEILARAASLWGFENGLQLAFSPAFLFAHMRDLSQVKYDGGYPRFSGTRWPAGRRIDSLDMVPNEELVGDTFVGASLQLRAMGLKIETRPAYRSNEATADAPWFHVGSLSAGYGLAFLGSETTRQDAIANVGADSHDWYRRVAWWQRMWRATGGPERQRGEYISALNAFIADAGLARDQIVEAAIGPLVTWAES